MADGARRELTLPFLGRRDYLHGTTLYRAIAAAVPAQAAACYKIMRIIRSNRVALVEGDGVASPVARLDWSADGRQGSVVVEELPPAPPIAREAYDEPLVADACAVDDAAVELRGGSPFDYVATLVPMFKALLGARGLTPGGGAWMFTRLDSEPVSPAFDHLRLTLVHALPRRIAKCRVEVDGRRAGELFYAWVAAG